MSDLHDLTDAFAELERRADAFGARTDDALATTPTAHRSRLPLIAASAAAVVVVAGGGAWLANQGGSTHHGTQAAASQPAAPATPAGQPTSAPPAPPATPTAARLPATPAQLADRFRAVLAGTATFTVTDTGSAIRIPLPAWPSTTGPEPTSGSVAFGGTPVGSAEGAAIVGQLTTGGVTGGFDLQWLPSTPGVRAQCDDPDRSTCKVQQLADGSSLATGTESLSGAANGVTYQAHLIRPDGTEFLMHVSNESDPKGESPVLADRPPLTIDQMVALVASPLWGTNAN
jgi:hypothetical protein